MFTTTLFKFARQPESRTKIIIDVVPMFVCSHSVRIKIHSNICIQAHVAPNKLPDKAWETNRFFPLPTGHNLN